jgi:hypothetical protein
MDSSKECIRWVSGDGEFLGPKFRSGPRLKDDLANAEEKIEAQAPAGRDLPGRRLARRLALPPKFFSALLAFEREENLIPFLNLGRRSQGDHRHLLPGPRKTCIFPCGAIVPLTLIPRLDKS